MRYLRALLAALVPLAGGQGSGSPVVDFALGVFGSFNSDLRMLTTITAADLDYRKNFEPALVDRFGPPILPLPNASFYPGLRVRPVLAEDGSQDSTAVWAVSNFVFGANGYPKVQAVLGPLSSNTGVATGACTGGFSMNQLCMGVQPEDVSDKTRFPYFFRYNSPSVVQGRVMWEYVVFFRFRTFTILTSISSAPTAQRDGILNAAAAAQRSAAITSLSIRESSANSDADHAEWDNAFALVQSARNRLVVLLPSLSMIKFVLAYMPTHGLSAPRYQLLLTTQIGAIPKWNIGMSGAHALAYKTQADSTFAAFVSMLMALNETDIMSGFERYALGRWKNKTGLRFDPARLSTGMIRSIPSVQQLDGQARIFNAFYVFVRAFGELLNQGVPPEAVGGERLRTQMAASDFAGVLVRANFDSNQDAILDINFISLLVQDVGGGQLVQSSSLLAKCQSLKGPDGATTYNVSVVAAALWATGDVAGSAPSALLACPPGQRLATTGIGVGNGPGICEACALGEFTNASDETECRKCPAGTFGGEARDSCNACPVGRYNPDKGATYCTSCMPGSVAEAVGSVGCGLCPLGTYSDSSQGGARCTQCDAGLTTAHLASLSAAACVCAEGSYRPLGSTICMPCGEGLFCPVGSDEANRPPADLGRRLDAQAAPYAQVKPGYFSKRGGFFSVYKCDSAEVCLGGPPESCRPGHQGLVCGDCAEGYHRSASGLCKACGSGDKVPLVLTALAAAVGVVALAVYSLHDEGSPRLTMVTAVLAAGQLVGCVQALSVIQQVKVVWSEPLTALWQLTAFLSFDLDVLKVQCILRSDRPVSNFLIQLFGLPAAAVVLGVTMLVATQCRRLCDRAGAPKRKCSTDRCLNLLGLMFVMTYISITVAMLRPLICRVHPNGLRSMVSRPSVVCWHTEEHRGLVTLSVIGVLCYPVGLLASVARGTMLYPRKVASGSLSHLSRFRFVFARFRPECYYWGLWYLSRNLALSLVPVAAADSGTFQMMALCVILLPFGFMEAFLMPWRTRLANLSELCSVLGLLIFLQAAAFLVGAQTGGSPTLVSNLLFTIVILSLAGVAAVVAYALYRTCSPGVQYGAFLCHHKEGAGSLARWFKVQAGTVSRAMVFLDSDQLEELDLIVDTVACRTKNVLVLLTSQTLARIWCAAELSSAVMHKVPIVQVSCSDYRGCTEDFMEGLDILWSETQKHSVAQYGITIDHIRRAYEHLSTLACVQLARFAPIEEQKAAAFHALHLCGLGTGGPPRGGREETQKPARIVIAGASGDAEARTTCEVLRQLIQTRVEVVVAAVHSGIQAEANSRCCAYLVVVLTRGLLQDESFTEVGLALDSAPGRLIPVEIVTVLADANFAFPDAGFFEDMEEQGDKKRLAAFLRKVFNILALPLSPHGSEGIMGAQVGELCRRFKASNLMSTGASSGSLDKAPAARIRDGAMVVTGAVLAAIGLRAPAVEPTAATSAASGAPKEEFPSPVEQDSAPEGLGDDGGINPQDFVCGELGSAAI